MVEYRYGSDFHKRLPGFFSDTDKDQVYIIAGDVGEFSKKGTAVKDILDEMCSRFKAVIYVAGNHEYYRTSIGRFDKKMREFTELYDNLHFLQKDSIIIDGVRIIGATLWSDTREHSWEVESKMNDYRYIRTGPEGLEWKRSLRASDTTSMHFSMVDYIEKEILESEEPCIVVTHHAPSTRSTPLRYKDDPLNCAYSTDLEIEKWPIVWIHGHIHDQMKYDHNGCIVLCNPLGYLGEWTDFMHMENKFSIVNGEYYEANTETGT